MQEGREKLLLVHNREEKAEEGEGLTEEGVTFPHQHLIFTLEPHTHKNKHTHSQTNDTVGWTAGCIHLHSSSCGRMRFTPVDRHAVLLCGK